MTEPGPAMRAYKTAVIARRTGPPSGFLASAVEVFADAAIAELEAELDRAIQANKENLRDWDTEKAELEAELAAEHEARVNVQAEATRLAWMLDAAYWQWRGELRHGDRAPDKEEWLADLAARYEAEHS
jgi:hypothetical protein